MGQTCSTCKTQLYNGESVIFYTNHLVHQKCLHQFHNQQSGRNYRCPQCNTTGKVNHPTEKKTVEQPLAPGEMSICGYDDCRGCKMCRNRIKYVQVPAEITCDLCKGHGYLATEPKPLIKQVGWSV